METQREIQKNMTVYKIDTIAVDGKPEVLFKCLKKLVGERGFEPPTPWSRTRCSTRLSHSPTRKADISLRQSTVSGQLLVYQQTARFRMPACGWPSARRRKSGNHQGHRCGIRSCRIRARTDP